ncbi:DUF1878 domain-containing protein [Sporosarcina thermotolerans]|uniref:DUF1878 domain-containing protein n=1 Tax=Sporosarcina thermotolerans TaxID=633404 RepID=A0AAW9AC08_9BACL|nr:DUF1878 domain-containing protein [Sporosarcina thermotolerans]MDW0118732.1 DUF1878 domain-containing protein [Sporosarcina thermotolerans]WHT48416.1 DUF1878 domain-containing protein [Sporosarcina thermotolerans]
MTIDERLDFIEYRQQLLFENTPYSRLLFEYRITEEQHEAIMDIFDEYRTKIGAGENVHHGSFEQRIYDAVPQHDGNYHFVEALAQENHRRESWEEVFATLYGNMQKYQNYMSQQD